MGKAPVAERLGNCRVNNGMSRLRLPLHLHYTTASKRPTFSFLSLSKLSKWSSLTAQLESQTFRVCSQFSPNL